MEAWAQSALRCSGKSVWPNNFTFQALLLIRAMSSAFVILWRRRAQSQPKGDEDAEGLLASDDYELGASFARLSQDSTESDESAHYQDKGGR